MALLIKNGDPDAVVDSIITEGDEEEEEVVILDVDVDVDAEVEDDPASATTTFHRTFLTNPHLDNEQ